MTGSIWELERGEEGVGMRYGLMGPGRGARGVVVSSTILALCRGAVDTTRLPTPGVSWLHGTLRLNWVLVSSARQTVTTPGSEESNAAVVGDLARTKE